MKEHDDMNCESAIPTRCAGHSCGTETAQHSPECILEAAIIQGWSTEDTLAAAKAVFDARATPPAAQVQGDQPDRYQSPAYCQGLEQERDHLRTQLQVARKGFPGMVELAEEIAQLRAALSAPPAAVMAGACAGARPQTCNGKRCGWCKEGAEPCHYVPPAAGVPFDDPRGEFRGWFEGWVLENEHPGYGWLGEGSLDQGDTPNSYADQYVHGAWVMAMHLSGEIKRVQFHSHLHLQRAKLAESAAPTPPASEQQQAVVMPDRRVILDPSDKYCCKEIECEAWNDALDAVLRLNPHLAGVNHGVTTEAGNGGDV